MSLIKSISGIRGTIGGVAGESLSPIDIVKFTSAFATLVNSKIDSKKKHKKIVVGRDARISGKMVNSLVTSTLNAMGFDVVDLGLSTTPTVEIAVTDSGADGGIIITASHNPKNWNALKLLNSAGEFISGEEGCRIIEMAEKDNYVYALVDELGGYIQEDGYIEKHIQKILALPLVDVEAIKKAKFRIAIDCVNSTGGIAIPLLLEKLGVEKIDKIYCEPDGKFPHNPEPLPENIGELSATVVKNNADAGFVVDPDVDRLAIVCENGEMFGEEYTLVSIADYVLKHTLGNTVSNLSSTRALKDVTLKAGAEYFASAVGEVNVVRMMKDQKAVIGGEGNGGVIYPELHYGRDALVGIALFLTHLAKSGKTCSELRASYPQYFISKNKIELPADADIDDILSKIKNKYKKNPLNSIDGLRIEFDKEWVHLRRSNTEPIIRIYSESDSYTKADHLARKIITDIKEIMLPEVE